jgi:hypothetical protein
VDRLLDVRVHSYHTVIKIGMFPHKHFRIPGHGDKDRIETTAQGGGENITDLESNQEREGDHDRCVGAIRVVCRRCEDEVEVGQQCASIGDECSSHGEHRPDQALVDKRIDTAILDHPANVSFDAYLQILGPATYFQVALAASI